VAFRRIRALRPCWWVRQCGLRGLFLLNLGVLDLLYGLTIAWPTPDQKRSVRYAVIIDMIPGLGVRPSLWIWAGIWWAVAAVCLFYAWRDWDTPAYACAFGLKIAWAVVNLVGFLQRMPDGASQVLVWVGFAVSVAIMSRVSEPYGKYRVGRD
jgi:hypothetical protein